MEARQVCDIQTCEGGRARQRQELISEQQEIILKLLVKTIIYN